MSFSVKTIFLIGVIVSVANCTLHTIGFRIQGDLLLMNDTLRTNETTRPQNHTIEFDHPVDHPITCIEQYTDTNVHAEFSLSSERIFRGTVIAVNVTELEMDVYGMELNETIENFEPLLDTDYGEYMTQTLMLGTRQPGDNLVHKIEKTTKKTTEPAHHSIVFEYEGDEYLTQARFVVIGDTETEARFLDVTQHSIKAIVESAARYSLDVEFEVYGYQPRQKPKNYIPIVSPFLKCSSSSSRAYIGLFYSFLGVLYVL